jgi:alpha-amylase
MKKIIVSAIMLLVSMVTWAVDGWPANYGGVMLQAFWWDSYDATKWVNLTNRADELSKYFDLIWVPNSGKTSEWHYNKRNTMGYDPCFWLDQNSCFGTEEELRTMIETYKSKGVGMIADIVVNHKNGLTGWAEFVDESVVGSRTGRTYGVTWDNTNYTGICSTDEANHRPESGVAGKIRGAADTGDDFDGYRDLDHTNGTVQQNIKTYLNYLINEMGYTGFRYDMVKGFAGNYVRSYNESSNPEFSVGECWDGYGTITNWINATGKTSAAFDFPLKYSIYEAFNNGNWGALANKGVVGDSNYSRYSITFVDNHDTGRTDGQGSNPLRNNWSAANAFILAMPGTPCIWLTHYNADRENIGKMILARKAAGVTNQSPILKAQQQDGGYVLETQGKTGSVYVQFGGAVGNAPAGYTFVARGDSYAFYEKITQTQLQPQVILSPSGSFTTPTYNVTATAENAVSAWYRIGNGEKVSFSATTTFTIGEGVDYGNDIVVSWGASDAKGNEQTGASTYTKRAPSAGVSVYVKASSAPYLYVWSEEGGNVVEYNGKWPGGKLSSTTLDGSLWYVFTMTDASVFNVIMSDGNGQTEDIKGVSKDTYFVYNGGSNYDLCDPNVEEYRPVLENSSEVSVFLETTSLTSPYVWVWGVNDINYTGGTWPGEPMMKMGTTVAGASIYKWIYKGGLTAMPRNIIFSDKGNNQTADLDFSNHGYYVNGTLTKTITEVAEEESAPDPDPVVTEVYITLSADAASYSSEFPLDFSEVNGLKAYIASGYVHREGELNVVLTPIAYVPANTGIVIRGRSGNSYTVPVADHHAVVGNQLVAVTKDKPLNPTDGDNTNMTFSSSAEAFIPLSSSVTLPAGVAYLAVPTSLVSVVANDKGTPYIFADNEATGVDEVTTDVAEKKVWYTLSGIRVDKPSKGIYICNGRKVIVK